MTTTTPAPAEAPDVAAALDMLLADAAVGVARRFRPAQSLLRLAGRLALRPALAARQGDDTQPDTAAGTEAPG